MDKDHLSLLDGPDDLQRASVCGSYAPARIDTDSIAGLQRQLGTKFLTKNLRCLRSDGITGHRGAIDRSLLIGSRDAHFSMLDLSHWNGSRRKGLDSAINFQ